MHAIARIRFTFDSLVSASVLASEIPGRNRRRRPRIAADWHVARADIVKNLMALGAQDGHSSRKSSLPSS
jgi:hypothetical protein